MALKDYKSKVLKRNFTVTMDVDLVDKLDKGLNGYQSRSSFIEEAVRGEVYEIDRRARICKKHSECEDDMIWNCPNWKDCPVSEYDQ